MSGTSTSGMAQAQVSDGPPATLLSRILDNVFPKVPDFFSLLNDQCEIMAQTMEALMAYMENANEENASTVRELEKKGDVLKARNFAILAKAFATPLDREDIYRAITSIDTIPNYAKTTVREIEVLQLVPDLHMLKMVRTMKNGTDALCRGFAKLSFDPLGAVEDERAVRLAVYEVEACFREAKAALFDRYRGKPQLDNQDEEIETRLMAHTIEQFKHREVYRHLFNLGGQNGHLAVAGQVLYDIMVQV
ncbi:MAG: DUF47 family protein [Magnetococcales bacterium]|nr:DUF47 family protein [Magnetococcales bacterium]